MHNCTVDRTALGPIDTPLSGRGRDKHFACAGCRLAKNFPTAAQAPAAAGTQIFETGTRRGLHNGDVRPIGSQFVSQNHCKGGTDTLTHFRFADRQRDRAILIDLNPAIGPKFTPVAQRGGVDYSSRSIKAENKRNAAKRARFYKSATRSSHFAFFGISAAARWIALRIRG